MELRLLFDRRIEIFQPRDGIELATFNTVVQRCNPLDNRIVTCNPLSYNLGQDSQSFLNLRRALDLRSKTSCINIKLFKNISFSLEIRVYCSYDHVEIVILNKIYT